VVFILIDSPLNYQRVVKHPPDGRGIKKRRLFSVPHPIFWGKMNEPDAPPPPSTRRKPMRHALELPTFASSSRRQKKTKAASLDRIPVEIFHL
jgi:hypothetical protein